MHAYFRRVDTTTLNLRRGPLLGSTDLRFIARMLGQFSRLFANLILRHRDVAWQCCRSLLWAAARNPHALKNVMFSAAMYPHLRDFTARVNEELRSEQPWADGSAYALSGAAVRKLAS